MSLPDLPVAEMGGELIKYSCCLAVVGLAAVLPAARLDAQASTSDPAAISARVLDVRTNEPIDGAILHLSGIDERFTTDPEGRAVLEVPRGSYILTVMSPGYRLIEGDFEVIRDGDFTLSLTPIDDFDSSAPGHLTGIVADAINGRSLANAEVRVGGDRAVLTDDDGRFHLPELETGPRAIEVRVLGYVVRREFITIVPGRTTSVEIDMAANALELPPIQVEIRSPLLEARGVYDRIARGVASHVVTRSDIESRPAARLSESMESVPGLTFQRSGPRSVALGRARCELAIYVDGVQMRRDIYGSVDFDMIPAEWVEAAEIYTGIAGVPIEFSNNHNGCGVVLVWTRAR